MLAIVCPGQGSQKPGFLAPWLELETVSTLIGEISSTIDVDLAVHGTTSDAETIRDTAVAQPLIVAAGLAALTALGESLHQDPPPGDGEGVSPLLSASADVLAGHSVGEITASVAAGVLSVAEAARFVGVRGRAMAAAAAVEPTGMSAVVGGDEAEVLARIVELGLTPANRNTTGQIVAAGAADALTALAADPPARARVMPLAVAGAFHSDFMTPAQSELALVGHGCNPSDPAVTLLSNADGEPLLAGDEVITRLVHQVANPVRWDLCMESCRSLGVTGILEVTPAGTLLGLAKRGLRGVDRFALDTPDDLEAAAEFVRAHAAREATD